MMLLQDSAQLSNLKNRLHNVESYIIPHLVSKSDIELAYVCLSVLKSIENQLILAFSYLMCHY